MTLDGEILVDVAAAPRQLVFAQVGLDTEATRPLTVKVTEPDKVKITKVSIDDDRFTVKLTDGDASGNATYDVVFKGGSEVGRLTGKVRIEYTGGDVPQLEVPLRGQVVGDLTYPQRLTFNLQDGKYTERDVRITSRSQKTVQILSAEDPDKRLEVEVTEAEGKSGVVHLTVANADAQAPGPIQGKLVVRTTDTTEPEVKIPYGIYKQGRRGLRPSPAVPLRRPKGLRPLIHGRDSKTQPK